MSDELHLYYGPGQYKYTQALLDLQPKLSTERANILSQVMCAVFDGQALTLEQIDNQSVRAWLLTTTDLVSKASPNELIPLLLIAQGKARSLVFEMAKR